MPRRRRFGRGSGFKFAIKALGLVLLVAAIAGTLWFTLRPKAEFAGANAPESASRAMQARDLAALPFNDTTDFDEAARGFVATLHDAIVGDGANWSLAAYAFLSKEEAPPSVNPSLWRQARLNMKHGLFEVVPRIYQVRGFDLSNMTIIEGDTGLIIIDPLITTEVARAALDLYYAHRPKRPVVAVIYSHSHVDHFGGVKGVVEEGAVTAGQVKVFAPLGFMEHAVSENVIAGIAMSRRAQFQFGAMLPPGPEGQVDAGLGKNLSRGTVTLIPPTDVISRPLDTRNIDGVEIRFQLVPGTEAPAEMHMYFPAFKALNMAENATHTLHNLLPFRGAEVRDALSWSKALDAALQAFGAEAEVMFAQHHWPVWGNGRLTGQLTRQRDGYRFLHDQTLRLINHGYTANEIAEMLRLPPTLANDWSLRGYYGTVSHNVKAIYQRYLGWYDANPAHLNPLPPVEQGRKMVEYMGGAAALIERARRDFEAGNYRWVAQVMNHLVFADPTNREARALGAAALEQLGFQAEAATWRNAYLTGAMELRNGIPANMPFTVSPDLVRALPLNMFFDLLGVRLNGPKAEGKHVVTNWVFTDTKDSYVLNLENSALTHRAAPPQAGADATISLSREVLNAIALKETSFPVAMAKGLIRIEGSALKVIETFALLDDFSPEFEVMEPKRAAR